MSEHCEGCIHKPICRLWDAANHTSGCEYYLYWKELLPALAQPADKENRIAIWCAVRMGRYGKMFACKKAGVNIAEWDDVFGEWDKE